MLRGICIILFFIFSTCLAQAADDCPPMGREALSSSLAQKCTLKTQQGDTLIEESVFFQYAAQKRSENLQCGLKIAKSLPENQKLFDQVLADTQTKAAVITKLKARRIEIVAKLGRMMPSIHREEMIELEKRKNELTSLIEMTYSSMYQGDTEEMRDFADKYAKPGVDSQKQAAELKKTIKKVEHQITEQAQLTAKYSRGNYYPDEFKRSLTKDLEIRSTFIQEQQSDGSQNFAEALTCNLDTRYGYAKEKSEAQRDAVLNTAALVIPVGTGFALARYGATALLAGKGFRIGSALVSGALTAVGTRDALVRSCGEFSRDVKISDCNEKNVTSFALNNMEKQSCLLETTLAGVQGLAALAPELALLKRKPATSTLAEGEAKTGAKVAATSSKDFGAINKDTLQERIWELKKAGQVDEARALEMQAIETLRVGKIVARDEIGSGMNKPQLVTFSDGTQGIWKAHSNISSNSRAEVAATLVDRHLGTNMVPVTVYREVDGVKGSVQLKVGKLKDGSKFIDDPEVTNLFDSLIGNFDRHRGNYLITEKGQIVAIDNGVSFREDMLKYDNILGKKLDSYHNLQLRKQDLVEKIHKLEEIPEGSVRRRMSDEANMRKLLQDIEKSEDVRKSELISAVNALTHDKKVVETLRQTTEQDWQRLLGAHLSPREISAMVTRQKTILKTIDKAEEYLGADAYPAGPTSPYINDVRKKK